MASSKLYVTVRTRGVWRARLVLRLADLLAHVHMPLARFVARRACFWLKVEGAGRKAARWERFRVGERIVR